MRIVGKASLEMPDMIYRTGWAVVIGVNKYPNLLAQFQLNYAVSDADAVAELIKKKFGFEENNVTILKDAQATKQGIMNALNYLTDPKRVKKDDCVLIYFSGHGQTVPLPEYGGGGNMGYLVPYDAQINLSEEPNMSQYDQYCIGMDELNKKGLQIPAKHVIFIVDACYSGLILESQRGLNPQMSDFVKKVASVPVRQIITAGGKEDQASENPTLGHGLFTYKLLQGLESGIADDNSDGVITGSELGNHLRGVVPKENARQIPQFRMKGEGEFMFLQVELANPPNKPGGASFNEIDEEIKRQQALKKQKEDADRIRREWDSKLAIMKEDFKKPKSYDTQDITPDLKAKAWKVFLDTYSEDNPFSTEDNAMRAEAIKQLDYWKNQPSETKPTVITGTSTIIGKDGAEMALIPAGEFQMGSNDGQDDEKPVHTVYLDAFYIDKYEVTNAQYKKFMDATGHKAPAYWNDSNYNGPKQPVVGVDWYDAKAYAEWAGKRLPTETEWEKSARGGVVGKKYVWGDEWPPPSKAGNFDDEKTVDNFVIDGYSDGYVYTSPVGSFKPNGYGLYDMAGNVWEWCADWYDSNYYANSPKSNPKGPDSSSSAVLRGGSWYFSLDLTLRVASRYFLNPILDYYLVGFRCVQ
jgi:formylglycine-generating enzyme required for sulfatase activity